MSSLERLFLFQAFIEAFTILYAILSADIPLFRHSAQSDITYQLERYSQTPSDAMIIILSYCVRVNSFISGWEVTPAWAPNLSPIDLVIANPGAFIVLSHTLSGPSQFPYTSCWAAILPPNLIMRIASSSRDGF